MSKDNKLTPKYILLTSSTLRNSRSTHNLSTTYQQKKLLQQSIPSKAINCPMTAKNKRSRMHKPGLVKNMESIKQELNNCMLNINCEQKRNFALNHLIELLGEQMKEIEQNQKRQCQVQLQTKQKKVHKVEYDIEQILVKHNEEIAKINSLKEQTASARSDRVVFSNLFKKIEKQIKHHESMYKEAIIKTEITRQSKARKMQLEFEEQEVRQESMDEVQPKQQIKIHIQMPKHEQAVQDRVFITNLNQKNMFHKCNLKKISERSGIQKGSIKTEGMDIKAAIEQVQTKIQKIVKVAESWSCNEAISHYSSLDNENKELMEKIQEQNIRIQDIQAEIQRLRIQRRISQIYETRQLNKLQILPGRVKLRSMKHIKTGNSQNSQLQKVVEDKGILLQSAKLLGIDTSYHEDGLLLSDQLFIQLQLQIDRLLPKKLIGKGEGSNGNMEQCLQGLLQKMQKFDNCDRIMSKQQFQTEYMRQLGKTKKTFRVKR